jgi:hypothetical protein
LALLGAAQMAEEMQMAKLGGEVVENGGSGLISHGNGSAVAVLESSTLLDRLLHGEQV